MTDPLSPTLRLVAPAPADAVPITPFTTDRLKPWLEGQPVALRAWVAGSGFTAEAGTFCLLPGSDGRPERVLAGIEENTADGFLAWGGLAARLPEGDYTVDPDALDGIGASRAALAWALGGYGFDRYKKKPRNRGARLAWPEGADRAAVERTAAATYFVRDLVNTPTADMGPADLADAAHALATRHGADCVVVVGDELIEENYPMIHAVGRAAARDGRRAPRLIDLRWGEEGRPRLTLVGKGVCFDTGGLDLKPATAMKMMKKDMGGAAHVLGLAHMVMDAGLPVRLRVLVPAVENSVAGDAMRPLDVLQTRKGITVEVGNTDAEGRLVLADALAEADREAPALLIDCATLTGAARVALGPDLPALFCNDDGVAEALLRHAKAEADPLWRLPLWPGYRSMIDGKTADLTNAAEGGFAGAITAALFLQEFVAKATPWAHIDLFAWNPNARPGRPEGGEAMALRALYALIAERFAGQG